MSSGILKEYPFDLEIERTLRRRRELREMERIGNDLVLEDPLQSNGREVDMLIPRVINGIDKPFCEQIVPILDYLNPRIIRPHIQAQHFKLKLVMFQMSQTIE